MSFRSVVLHHSCYLSIKSQLSINPFTNLISDIHGLSRPKSYRSYYHFHIFRSPTTQAHKQKQQKETILKIYKTIFPSQSHNLAFLVSNVTPPQWVSINSRYIGTCRILSNVVFIALRNITHAVQELQLNITNSSN